MMLAYHPSPLEWPSVCYTILGGAGCSKVGWLNLGLTQNPKEIFSEVTCALEFFFNKSCVDRLKFFCLRFSEKEMH